MRPDQEGNPAERGWLGNIWDLQMTTKMDEGEDGLWVEAWVSGLFEWIALLPPETEMEKMRAVGDGVGLQVSMGGKRALVHEHVETNGTHLPMFHFDL